MILIMYSKTSLLLKQAGVFGLAFVLWCVLSACCLNAAGQTLEFKATADVWIREYSPNSSAYEDDLVSVWSSHGNDGARRYGLLEFDLGSLAGLEIGEITMGLYSGDHGFSDYHKPIKQNAWVIDCPDGVGLQSLTWNSYMSQIDGTKVALETLGYHDLPTSSSDPAQQNKYVDSIASTADLSVLGDVIAGGGRLCVVLIADEDDGVDYAQSWGDDGHFTNPGYPAVLTVSLLDPKAYSPSPFSMETNVARDVVLTWRAGLGAMSHDIYFGTDDAEVLNANDPDTPPGRGRQLAGNETFSFGELEYETTYYWRIDEVNIDGVEKGAVWSFVTVSEAMEPSDPAKCPAGDINGDCIVDFADLVILAGDWPGIDSDFGDFGLLADDWDQRLGPVVISEFVASNASDLPLEAGELLDGNGESSDWIELFNPTGHAVDMGGWYLTDNSVELDKWRFPAGAGIEGGDYMVIFASSKKIEDYPGNYPYIDGMGYLHTNFSLQADSEYLALVEPDGTTVVQEYSEYYDEGDAEYGYPPQETDISYGLYSNSNRYFDSPTPGEINDNSFINFVADTKFSHNRGFYDTPFNAVITCSTSGARIYYTLDGSSPIDASGLPTASANEYTAPVNISSTTPLRAAAVKAGWQPTDIDSNTYFFLDDVIRQPEMDTDVVGPGDIFGGTYAATIKDDLKAIPTLSISMKYEDFRGSGGIYDNPHTDWEKPCSAELIHADGTTEGFQINCGIRIFGGGGRSWPKKSFRLLFKEIYGPTKLEHPLFPGGPVERFDTVVLRNTVDTSWIDSNPVARGRAQYIRDLWHKDTAGDMGQETYLSNTYVHLYFNGTYWGLYAPAERPDASFMAEHLGGVKEDYDAMSHGTVVDGNMVAWNAMMSIVNAGVTNYTDYLNLREHLDVPKFIDYLLANLYSCNIDWPIHLANRNWRAAGPKIPGNGGFKIFSWDTEISFDSGWHAPNDRRPYDYDNVTTIGDFLPGFGGYSPPVVIYDALKQNAEFRLLFGDHIHRHCFNDGALTYNQVSGRWMGRADEIDEAIVAESARWGDQKGDYPPRSRDVDWISEQDRLVNDWFLNRSDYFLQYLRDETLYPNTGAPSFNIDGQYQHGGAADPGAVLTMTVPSSPDPGAMSYTTLLPSFAPCRALVPSSDSLAFTWTAPGFTPDGNWTNGTNTAVGFDINTSYDSLINTDMETEMYNTLTSVYIRIPFNVTSGQISDMDELKLKMKYEDGFIAYINSAEAASRQDPAYPYSWSPSPMATGDHPDGQAVVFEEFDITDRIGDLQDGSNMLAIHGFNFPLHSSDLLMLPEIEMGELTGGGGGPPAGVIVYCTLDGSDPRLPGGGVNVGSAFQYSDAIQLQASTHVKARTYDGGSQTWSALNEAVYAVGPIVQNLRITEIMYRPQTPPNNAAAAEFIELKNIGGAPLDLNLVRFTEGIHFAFDALTLPAGGFVIVVKDEQVFSQYYPGFAGVIAGAYTGSLANNGERIRLEDAIGRTILDFKYKDGWRDITDGEGFSLTVIDPDGASAADWGLERTWRASVRVGGSPGTDDEGILPNPGDVVINEVLAHSHDLPDWIELRNTTNQKINLEGWFLSDSDRNEPNLMKYEIGDVSIAAGGFVVFREDVHFNNPADPGCEVPFALSEYGEMVCLTSPVDIEGRLTGYRRKQLFGASLRDVSFGRHQKSTGTYNFVSMSENTPGLNFEGLPNADPQVGPVVISEIMYHPDWPVNSVYENDQYEYVELLNILEPGAEPVVLGGQSSGWKFTDGIEYAFPPGTTLSSGQRIVIARNPQAFLARYPAVPAQAVFGPFADGTGLSNSGESIELSRPGDFDVVQYHVVVDRVNYSDGSHDDDFDSNDPWPTEADGKGKSLIRVAPQQYGNDVANWQAGQPSPQM